MGELRQGALEGLVLDAIAKAAAPARRRPCARRRCTRATWAAWRARRSRRARPASPRFTLQLLSPGLADAGQPGRRRGGRARAAGRGRLRVQGRRRAHPAPQGGRRGARVHAPPAGRDRRACPRSWSGRARCRRASWCWRARPSRCGADGRPQPFQATMSRFGRSKDVRGRARAGAAVVVLLRPAAASRARARWSRCPTRERAARLARAGRARARCCRAS